MDDEQPPSPARPVFADAWKDARKIVEDRRKAVEAAVNRDIVSKEAALLAAASARETAVAMLAAADLITLQLSESTRSLDRAEQRLTATITDFTNKADRGTNRLATWTMWLAIVTGLLVVAAFAQAWVTWTAAPQVVVVPFTKP